MNILNYVVKRILQMIPVFFVVTILIFFLIRLIPGDPASVMLGERATPEAVAAIHEKMGLDKPYPVQFLIFMKNLCRFDLGDSIKYGQPVSELLRERFLPTLLLTVMTTLFCVLFSFIPGYIAGMKKGKLIDNAVRVVSLSGIAVPPFWIGIMLLTVFGVHLRWFSVSGWGETWTEHIKGLILPSITQAFAVSGIMIRNLRNNVVEIKNNDYVDFARSKGVSEKVISRRHIIRNSLIPTVTLLSLKIAGMLSGSVVIETVFTLPGIGALLVNSIYARDYAIIQGVVLIFVIIVMLINLVTDILYSVLDPRVKLS